MTRFHPFLSRLLRLALLAACPGPLLAVDPSPAPSPTPTPTPAGKAEHVLIVVWDGLRPDSVTEETTPTLARLAREGVTFTRHHPVYPSSTEVNGTAMATGCYPGHSGLIGNREYRPAIDPLKTVATEALETIRKGDEVAAGKYLRVPTLPELAQIAGWRTDIAGTKAVAALWDRGNRADAGAPGAESVTLAAGKTLPPGAVKAIDDANGGPFPAEIHLPNTDEDAWTTRALTNTLWKDGPAKFSVLWLSDPDFTQHQFGPDSPQARRALAGCDANLAAVLTTLDAGHQRDKTDVFVVSDHGFSTIKQPVDVAARLTAAGFSAVREYKDTPKPGDVLVDGLGGAVFLYVAGHEADTIKRLVDFFQRSEFAGVIFTAGGFEAEGGTAGGQPGTFPLGKIFLDSPDAPDVVVSMRWNDDKNAAGLPGGIFSDGPRRAGQGNHATLSRYEMHNTLIAAGPDFRPGFRDELPSSNADLAPTVAHLLGLPHPPPMDGRILAEALSGEGEHVLPPATTRRFTASRGGDGVDWSQYLQVTSCEGETYFDEGNAVNAAPPLGPSPTRP